MVVLKFISTGNKHFQSWQYSEQCCHSLCHCDVFIIMSKHTAWLEDSEAVPQLASKEKMSLKISQNLPENICVRVSF